MTRRARAPLPRYVREKRSASGAIRWYWEPPTWARVQGCPARAEALGDQFAAVHERAAFLNRGFDAWRLGRNAPAGPEHGTFAWLLAEYRQLDAYSRLAVRTRLDADAAMALVRDFPTKQGTLGAALLEKVTSEVAQHVYRELLVGPDGAKRPTSVNRTFRYLRAAWNAARRAHRKIVPDENPFADLELVRPKGDGGAKAATRAQLNAFVAAADALGLPAIGTAAVIGFELLIREADIVAQFAWSDWRPAEHPDCVIVRHGKTKRHVDPYPVPLFADDGDALYPEMCARVEATPRLGPLVIMNDRTGRSGVSRPYTTPAFLKRVRQIREAAGLPASVTFASFRKGGLTELGKSGFTDREMLGLSGHRTVQMLAVYSQADVELRRASAVKRKAARTKRAGLSE